MTDDIGPPLSADEGRQLLSVLARHRTQGVAQFDAWRLSLPTGDFFVLIEDSGTPGGLPVEFFREVWRAATGPQPSNPQPPNPLPPPCQSPKPD